MGRRTTGLSGPAAPAAQLESSPHRRKGQRVELIMNTRTAKASLQSLLLRADQVIE